MLCRTLIAGAVLAALLSSALANDPPLNAVLAAALVEKAEADLARMFEHQNRAQWVHETTMTADTEWLYSKATADQSDLAVGFAKAAARYDGVALDAVLRRKLTILKKSIFLPAPATPGASSALAALSSRLERRHATSVVRHNGADLDASDANRIMGSLRDPAEMKLLWEAARADFIGGANDYTRLSALTNAGARELGHADLGAFWRAQYDMPERDFATLVDRIWGQVEPLYKNLHCYVRTRLNEKYTDAVQPRTGPIRADLLGDLSSSDWQRIFDVVAPKAFPASADVTKLLVDAGYDAEKMVRAAETFFTSLGFAPMPDTFWQRSILVKPQGREFTCHPAAFAIDGKEDVRIRACFRANASNFQTAHHELGHSIYQLAYREQPYLFQDSPNDGFHEALGDFIGLYALTPTYLHQIGLVREQPARENDIPVLLNSALSHVALLPSAVINDKWRWRVFSGETPPAKYNDDWWSLARQYQGIVPPGPRPPNAFDPGAFFHISASFSYSRYLLADLYQFQFFRAACRIAGWTGPLNRCSIYGNRQVGERLNAMLRLGASKPWPDALEAFTGERDVDAGAMLDYYAPLDRWLTEQNRGESCGW